MFATIGVGALVLLAGALPTWTHVSASLNVAQNIASTANAGNLPSPLKSTLLFGVWLRGSYKQPPTGIWHVLTLVLIVVVAGCCVLGVLHLLRSARHALLAWIALMLLAWIVLRRSATTWVGAKALVLTSPIVVLLAWGGVAALAGPGSRRRVVARSREPAPRRAVRPTRNLRPLAALLALALLGGVLASDVAQYHSSNLAPTARYEELASVGDRFAGRGPALFTDFDEYSMYALRRLDVGGPDFVYPPPALAALAGGYGRPVLLDRASPQSLTAYPLIVTRRDPSGAQPPSAYRLAWQGDYYDVWKRSAGATPAVEHVGALNGRALACARVRALVDRARARGLVAVGAQLPEAGEREARHGTAPARVGTRARRLCDAPSGHTGRARARATRGHVGCVAAGAVHGARRASPSTGGRPARSPASWRATRSCPTRPRRSPCA